VDDGAMAFSHLAHLLLVAGRVGPRATTAPVMQLDSRPIVTRRMGFGSSSASSDLPIKIDVTGINSRCISASIVIEATPAQVWSIISDYDNLSTHVPNLVESSVRPNPGGAVRVFQEGAQSIVGFDFRASLTMDMTEVAEDGARKPNLIQFALVDSQMFASFDGEWRVEPYSRRRSSVDLTKFEYRTKVSYRVNITPKGLVPIPALEWRIREDVPVNLRAVRDASERVAMQQLERRKEQLVQQQQEEAQASQLRAQQAAESALSRRAASGFPSITLPWQR